MSDNQQPPAQPTRSRFRVILTWATFLALAILVFAIHKQIIDVIHNLRRVDIWALLLIIPIQILNYDSYARLFQSLFKILGEKVDYKAMYKLTLELNFVNHILPSGGVSGISYFSVRMRANGVSTAKSTFAQVLKLVILFISFQPLLLVGLILLAAKGHVNGLILVIASMLITLLIVGTLLGVYVIESRSRINTVLTYITRALNWLINLFRLGGHPETINIASAQHTFSELHDNYQVLKSNFSGLKKPLLFCLVANATEIATIYVVYIAFGSYVNVGAVILAYAVANFAGFISVLPAGIGVYEGLMTAVLAATGIKPELSIPVTVMYRVCSMFVQLVPGYFFYQRALKSSDLKIKR